ncbi:O-antigen ligase [Pedobacter sp. SYSU D00535]|uniref:O-antigen ligase family protein n=1 Tax=Pedobacter sp. SYSU D00535 TaxID=2810308 RepID=UPI001A96E4A5|nr:O-antigen ligase family protein [Pedobacter sp. SYSU D00535]
MIQYISFKIGFRYGYDYSWMGLRVISDADNGYLIHSIFSEPAHFGIVLSPALFISIYNIFESKDLFITRLKSLAIILAIILTSSSTAYAAILFSLIFYLVNNYKKKKSFLLILVAIPLFLVLYFTIHKFQTRVNSLITFNTEGQNVFENTTSGEVDGSTLILLNGFYVASQNTRAHPLFGTGIGSYSTAFEKFSLLKGTWMENLNKEDGNSLFNRLLTEFGIVGLLLLVYFLKSHYVSKKFDKSPDEDDWVLSSAVLVLVLSFLLRQGHYFINGFPLFIWSFYFIKKINSNERNR